MTWTLLLTHAALMVALGMALEVVFTAFAEFRSAPDWRLKGHTYVWMVPIYALIYPLLCVLYPRLAGVPFPLRGVLYTAMIYAVEYSSGWVLRRTTGNCPWEDGYLKSPWGVHGLVRLDYAPFWFAASLLYESVFRVLRGL